MPTFLKPDHESLLRRKVAAGLYGSMEEAIARALELLDEYDRELTELRERIHSGIEQADEGQLVPAREVFEELRRHNAQMSKPAE